MCEMTQAEALREVIAHVDGTRNYRVGGIEIDHSEDPNVVYLTCIKGGIVNSKDNTIRFQLQHLNDRGLHLLKTGGISMIDWGARLCLETDLDPEGNPVNAIDKGQRWYHNSVFSVIRWYIQRKQRRNCENREGNRLCVCIGVSTV